ncbi:MAG: GtrA family protein [Bacteroidota bacterium]
MLSRYLLFAVLATGLNIGLQALTIYIIEHWIPVLNPYSLWLAMAVGTGSGLIFKYILDKFFVFDQQTGSAAEETKAFFIYTFLGVFTTLIFWGVEWGFDHFWGTPEAKYIGAVTGLAIGYVIKYFLDKRFVFQQ